MCLTSLSAKREAGVLPREAAGPIAPLASSTLSPAATITPLLLVLRSSA